MRKALLVGIDDYPTSPLYGCVNDAKEMAKVLRYHENRDPNFECQELLSTNHEISQNFLSGKIEEFFTHNANYLKHALFYFSGHGIANAVGGYLITQDAQTNALGVSMRDVMTWVSQSPIDEITIILDCCDSGAFGIDPTKINEHVELRRGVTLLTASGSRQSAIENVGNGIFTSLVLSALEGGAADIIGNVNAASVYSYVDQTLGAFEQRPHFKANISNLTPLRKCRPQVTLDVLRHITKYFESESYEFLLDPSYEPELEPRSAENEIVFDHLQKYRAARLLVPIGEDHLYFAAKNSKPCKLTKLGQFYWHLVNKEKI